MPAIRKAIIPAAGLGTRFLPATKAMPKEMLPIVDKPTIQYTVEEAVASGIEEIMIVTGRSKRAIEDHFDASFELETILRERGKTELLRDVQAISDLADIHYVRQKMAYGLGHAIWCARKFIGDEPFAVLLGDMIIDSKTPCLKQMIDAYEQAPGGIIAVTAVDWSHTGKYGIVETEPLSGRLSLIRRLIEKPKERPASNLAMVGRYILPPELFEVLASTEPGAGGEIQLTDALQELARVHPIYAYQYDGKLYDTGDKLGFLQATVDYAMKNESLRGEFRPFLEKVVGESGQERSEGN